MTDATSPLLKEHSMIACGQVFSATIISIVASFSGRVVIVLGYGVDAILFGEN